MTPIHIKARQELCELWQKKFKSEALPKAPVWSCNRMLEWYETFPLPQDQEKSMSLCLCTAPQSIKQLAQLLSKMEIWNSANTTVQLPGWNGIEDFKSFNRQVTGIFIINSHHMVYLCALKATKTNYCHLPAQENLHPELAVQGHKKNFA